MKQRPFLSLYRVARSHHHRRQRYPMTCLRHFATDNTTENRPQRGSTKEKVHKLRDHLENKESDEFHSAWEDLWKDGVTPWDLGGPTPLLVSELQNMRQQQSQGISSARRLTSLVPGCGQGYDLCTLADHHDELVSAGHVAAVKSLVIGLDISCTSLELSKQHLLEQHMDKRKTQVKLQCGNFFDSTSQWSTVYETHSNADRSSGATVVTEDMQFDFIYDYTFFCALRPNMRSAWAKRMKELLRPPTGQLMTIMYPILPGEDVTKGPPYPVTVDDYRSVLEPLGVRVVTEPFESKDTVAHRAGKELVCYWSAPAKSPQ